MAESTAAVAEPVPRRRKMPLIVGLVAAVVSAGGGFYATSSGLLQPGQATPSHAADPHREDTAVTEFRFVAIEPIIISLGPDANARHLRFAAQLEVKGSHLAEVTHVMPRILDVLNGYLRAVETPLLQDPSALSRLKAQMLRRVQIVVGEDRVQDLLISEFVLN